MCVCASVCVCDATLWPPFAVILPVGSVGRQESTKAVMYHFFCVVLSLLAARIYGVVHVHVCDGAAFIPHDTFTVPIHLIFFRLRVFTLALLDDSDAEKLLSYDTLLTTREACLFYQRAG